MLVQKINYVLQLADNALILGHRLSEWCGHGPILEQDIAITNMALDHLGQARALYQYAAELYNQLPAGDQKAQFQSPVIFDAASGINEDHLAYLRDGWDYKNTLLAEQPNGNWADTIARSFFYDQYTVLLYRALQQSADTTLAAIGEKSLKEVTYHRKWSSEWVIRLGDGTEESKTKMQAAIDNLWPYTGELFIPSPDEQIIIKAGDAANMPSLLVQWQSEVASVLQEADLVQPAKDAWMHTGGKTGSHTEHLGYILAEMQHIQRAYPGLEW